MLKLGNLRWGDFDLGWKDIRIDRASILGNPFDMGEDEGLRDLVCDTYKDFLWENLKAVLKGKNTYIDPANYGLDLAPKHKKALAAEIVAALVDLMERSQTQDLRLMCWCVDPDKPVRCHGEMIIRAITWMQQQTYDWHMLLRQATVVK